MKKLFAIILTICLLASLSVSAFAAEPETSTITVVMKDSGGDGWDEGYFGFVSLSTDELVLGDGSGTLIEGITEYFILEDGTTATITHTVAKDEAVYFRWGGEGDEEASFNIYRDGILQYSCDDATKFDGRIWELFFTSYPVEGTTITYTVNPTYTVTIPTDVTIDGNATTISAENVVVEKGKYVSVSLAEENSFTVTTAEGATLDYTVTANGANVAAGDEILAVNPADGKTGTATITFDIDETAIQYAGTYTGSATFTIAVKYAPGTTINFTIDGTSYQAEVGMTWAQWVLSDYNNGGFVLDSYGYPMVWSGHNAVCCPDAANAWTHYINSATKIESGLAYTLLLMAG